MSRLSGLRLRIWASLRLGNRRGKWSATISLKLGPKMLNLNLKPQSKMRYEIFDCNARAGTPEVCQQTYDRGQRLNVLLLISVGKVESW